MLSKQEKFCRLRLIRSYGVGAATYWRLLKIYGTAEKALSIIPRKYSEEQAEQEILTLRKYGIRLIFFEDQLYPPRLKEIPAPPPVLSFIGNREKCLELFARKTLAIVGARNTTLNGAKLAFAISKELSNSMCIVSGLAKGIDTAAHEGSLENGTIAVLAGGINKIYPKENINLYKNIIKNGGIFSEMPIDTVPTAPLFPRRNSLIAGISDGILVVEAAQKSGSLITAKIGMELGREIFAIPNSPIDVRSQGCNELIRHGATIVTNCKDIIDVFSPTDTCEQTNFFDEKINFKYNFQAKKISIAKKIILQLLDSYEVDIADLLANIKSSPDNILQAILELELENKIQKIGESKFTRAT